MSVMPAATTRLEPKRALNRGVSGDTMIMIGAVGTVLIGITIFGEAAGFARLACVGLILAGIVGLKLYSPA